MTDDDLYTVAGRDLRPVVRQCLVALADPEKHGLGPVVEAETDPAEKIFYGKTYVMSYVAPRTWGSNGTDEELLLFAALAIYGEAPQTSWEGAERHIEKALEHLRELGEAEGARRLIVGLAVSAEPDEASRYFRDWINNGPLGGDPARIAAHEGVLSQGTMRTFRAARALDPSVVSPWDLVRSPGT